MQIKTVKNKTMTLIISKDNQDHKRAEKKHYIILVGYLLKF